jgi:hypothetical protein
LYGLEAGQVLFYPIWFPSAINNPQNQSFIGMEAIKNSEWKLTAKQAM